MDGRTGRWTGSKDGTCSRGPPWVLSASQSAEEGHPRGISKVSPQVPTQKLLSREKMAVGGTLTATILPPWPAEPPAPWAPAVPTVPPSQLPETVFKGPSLLSILLPRGRDGSKVKVSTG